MICHLKFRNGDQRGKRVAIEELPFVVGRDRECSLVLATRDVSRQHCGIQIRDDKVWIVDLNSRNGTLINKKPAPPKTPVQLTHQDKVQIGKWKFRFLDASVENADKAPKKPADAIENSLLDELEAIAATLDRSADFATLPSLSSKSNAEDQSDTDAEQAEIKSEESPNEEPPDDNQDRLGTTTIDIRQEADSDQESDEIDAQITQELEEDDEHGPQRLPDHLRPKTPIDSQDAAQQALKKLFGG